MDSASGGGVKSRLLAGFGGWLVAVVACTSLPPQVSRDCQTAADCPPLHECSARKRCVQSESQSEDTLAAGVRVTDAASEASRPVSSDAALPDKSSAEPDASMGVRGAAAGSGMLEAKEACGTNNGGCEQRCMLANGMPRCECEAGSYLRADQKSCARWAPAVQLSMGLGNLFSISAAVASEGEAHVVWAQGVSTSGASDRAGVWTARFHHRTGWSNPTQLSSVTAGTDAMESVLTIHGDGDGFAAWFQSAGTAKEYWASRFGRQSGWEKPLQLGSGGRVTVGTPISAAASAGGTGLAMFVQHLEAATTPRDAMYVSRFVAGSGWSTTLLDSENNVSVQVNGGTLLIDATMPVLRVDDRGTALALWTTANKSLDSKRFSPASGWGPVVRVPTERPSALCYVLAMNAGGEALAVWKEGSDASTSVRYSTNSEAGGWAAARTLSDTGDIYCSPRLVMNARGDAFLVSSQASSASDLWAKHYVTNDGWAAAVRISSGMSGSVDQPDIALDAQGGAVAVWKQVEPDGARLWANRFSVEAGWGQPARITGAIGIDQPRVVVDATGRAIAIWLRPSGGTNELWASTFE